MSQWSLAASHQPCETKSAELKTRVILFFVLHSLSTLGESYLPSHWRRIRPVVYDLGLDTHARQVCAQHQASRAGAHDTDLALGGSLWHASQEGDAIDAIGANDAFCCFHIAVVATGILRGGFEDAWRHGLPRLPKLRGLPWGRMVKTVRAPPQGTSVVGS